MIDTVVRRSVEPRFRTIDDGERHLCRIKGTYHHARLLTHAKLTTAMTYQVRTIGEGLGIQIPREAMTLPRGAAQCYLLSFPKGHILFFPKDQAGLVRNNTIKSSKF